MFRKEPEKWQIKARKIVDIVKVEQKLKEMFSGIKGFSFGSLEFLPNNQELRFDFLFSGKYAPLSKEKDGMDTIIELSSRIDFEAFRLTILSCIGVSETEKENNTIVFTVKLKNETIEQKLIEEIKAIEPAITKPEEIEERPEKPAHKGRYKHGGK